MSKPFRIIVIVFGLLIGLYLAALAVTSSAWFDRLLLRRVSAALESLSGAHVEIRQLLFQPFSLQVSFRGLVLHGQELPTQPPLFSAQTLVLGLSPAAALRRRLVFRSLYWENAEIHIYTHADGSTNLPGPEGARVRGSPVDNLLDLAIRRLTIVRTSVFWNDRRWQMDLSARNVALILNYLRQPQRYAGSVSSSELKWKNERWSLPPSSFSVQLEFSPQELDLKSLVWRCSGVTARGSADAHRLPILRAELSLQADGEVQGLAQALDVRGLRGGSFHLETLATYQDENLAAKGRVQGQGLLVASSPLDLGRIDVSADYSADRHHIDVSNLRAAVLGGFVEGQAQVSMEGTLPGFSLRSRLRGLNLQAAWKSLSEGRELLSRLPLAASVSGAMDAKWSGKPRNLTSNFDLTFEPPPAGGPTGARPLSGHARGAATAGQTLSLEVESADLHLPHSSLTGQGTLSELGSNLTFRLQTSDFAEWRSPAELLAEAPVRLVLKSSATLAGSLAGSLNHPEIRGQLSLGPVTYQDSRWDGLEAGVLATPDLLQISSGRVTLGNSTLSFDLSASLRSWELAPDAELHVVAQAQRIPVESLQDALSTHYPLTGLLAGHLKLDGKRASLAATGDVEVEHGAFATEPFDLLAAQFQSAASVWNLKSIQLLKGAGRLTGHGRLDSSSLNFSIQLQADDFSLADIQWLGARQKGMNETATARGLEGVVKFNLNGEGSFENPHLDSTLEIQKIRENAIPLGDLSAQVHWRTQGIRLQGKFQGGGGVFDFTGATQTRGDWPAQLRIQCTHLRADPWIPSLEMGKLGATVDATGTLEITGPLKKPERLAMHGQLQELAVSFPGLKWKNDRPVDVSLADQVVTVSRFELTGPSTHFAFQGSLRLNAPASLAATAEGRVDASLLTALDPSLLAAGGVDVQLRAGGTPEQPLLYGSLKVQNVSLGYPSLPLRISELNGEARLDGDRLTLTSLHGGSGAASFDVTGSVFLSRNFRYDLRVQLHQARLLYPVDFTSFIAGHVSLAGNAKGGVLRGDITVKQLVVSQDFNVVNWLDKLGSQPPAPLGPTSSPASKIRLEVNVASAPVVALDSNSLSLVADIGMTIRGTLDNPVAFGNIHIQRGRAVVRGTTYKLTRGDITMANPLETQPVLDLEVQTRVQRYDVLLSVTGPADRPKLAYRSDPPRPVPDILALLAFGYSRQEQVLSNTGAGSFGTVGASAVLTQVLSSQKSSRIERIFGVSRIGFEPNPTGLTGARLTVEQQLRPDVTITYATTTSGAQQQAIQIEWNVSERVSLVAVRDQNGVYGTEIIFRRRYK